MFVDSTKWNIGSTCALHTGPRRNKFALRTLQYVWKTGDQERQHEIWERLIKVGFEDVATAPRACRKTRRRKRSRRCISYYKNPTRYINRRQLSPSAVWRNSSRLQADDLEGFMQIGGVFHGACGDRSIACWRPVPALPARQSTGRRQSHSEYDFQPRPRTTERAPNCRCLLPIGCRHSPGRLHKVQLSSRGATYRSDCRLRETLNFVKALRFHRAWGLGRISPQAISLNRLSENASRMY